MSHVAKKKAADGGGRSRASQARPVCEDDAQREPEKHTGEEQKSPHRLSQR